MPRNPGHPLCCFCTVHVYIVNICTVNICTVNICTVNICTVNICTVHVYIVNICTVRPVPFDGEFSRKGAYVASECRFL
jgi:hypothetical protein